MRKMYLRKVLLFVLAMGLFPALPAVAQFSLDLDIMSRYVWRGTDFGDSPSIQPGMSYTMGGLEFGVWAAYATTGEADGTEVDLWASYTLDTDAGSFTFSVTDYTFPVHHMAGNGAESWFDSDAHFVELGIGYEGTESLPISIFAGMFVHNDDDNSVYVELGYDADPIAFFLGFTPFESEAYGTSGAGIINLGFTGSKELVISDAYALGLTSSFIVNPYTENVHLIVGISF